MCVLPWTHLEVDVNGSASPCCLYRGEIADYKVYRDTLDTIQNSEYMNELRTQFRQGGRPAGCSNCWQEEDAGKTSKRMNSIYKMKNRLQEWTPETMPTLKFIDFIFESLIQSVESEISSIQSVSSFSIKVSPSNKISSFNKKSIFIIIYNYYL